VSSRTPAQRYLAEFLGTFALVFAGCGAVISQCSLSAGIGNLGIAVTFGAVVGTMVCALGPISAGRFPGRHVPFYLAAQCLGALLASTAHWFLFGAAAANGAFGATTPTVAPAAAVGFEILLTFLLMLVIMAVATDRRAPGAVPGPAIGGTVLLCALFGGPATGASLNPARSLGPALFAGEAALRWLPIYLLAPVVGAVMAAFTYELLRDGSEHACSAPADLT